MSRYWIFDREDTPQGLPLRQLVTNIREAACASGCRFVVRRSQGYGSSVCHWDDLLDQTDEITVSPDELERLSAGAEEWFYELDARCVTPAETIAFGLHDSSALFLDASAELAEKIIADFKEVRIE
jgi:hypothetical protein